MNEHHPSKEDKNIIAKLITSYFGFFESVLTSIINIFSKHNTPSSSQHETEFKTAHHVIARSETTKQSHPHNQSLAEQLERQKTERHKSKDPADKLIIHPLSVFKFIFNGLARRKILVISTFVILFFLPIAYLTTRYQSKTEAAWMDDQWGYRQTVAITNAGTAQTDFQVSITLNTSALVTAGKMQSDCDDIRITDVNGKILAHWIETGTNACNTATTAIWTKVPSISTTGTTVYLYYGHPSATNTQNGTSVFVFFDDFSSSAIDSLKWSQGTIAATSGTSFSISSGTLAGGNNNRYIQSTSTFTGDYIAETRVYTTSGATNGYTTVGFFGSTSNNFGVLDHGSTSYYRNDSSWVNFTYNGGGQWNRDKVKVVGTGATYWRTGETSGSSTGTATNSGISAEYLRLSSRYDNGNYDQNYTVTWDWVMIRKTAATEPSVAAPANEQKSAGPVAYWKFDEGYGGTANNSTSVSGINGTITGATWQTSDQCVSEKCLKFNGSSNYTDLTNSFFLQKFIDTSDFTISAWIKPNSLPSEYTTIVGQRFGDSMVFGLENTGKLYLNMDDTRTSSPKSNTTISTNKWQHVSVTFKGSDASHAVAFYLNGSLDGTGTSYDGNGSENQSNLFIGWQSRTGQGADSYFNGFIDDVKIYGYVRSAAQIKSDFASKGSGTAKGTSVSLSSSRTRGSSLSDGLVGYWKMDEASGNAVDSSGNGNTGTWAGSGSHYIAGKFGNGGGFGTNDTVSIPHNSVLKPASQITISAWVKPTNITTNTFYEIYRKEDGSDRHLLSFQDNGTILSFGLGTATPGYQELDVSITASNYTDGWHLITATYDGQTKYLYRDGVQIGTQTATGAIGTTGTANAYIGSSGGTGEYFAGNIDETRVYNRALSPREVRDLYNWAPGPQVYFPFDEHTGTSTVYDKSGNGLTGSMQGTMTQNDWVPGKFGSALDFDGTDDWITVNDPGSNSVLDSPYAVTFEAWFYTTSLANRELANKSNSWGQDIWLLSNGILRWYIRWDDDTYGIYDSISTFSINTWNHLTLVVDTSIDKYYIYKNGVLDASGSIPSARTIKNSDDPLYIGTWGNSQTYAWPGKIDDVKIYNYARNSKQIVEDMNAGHPVGGSPVGSQVGYWKFDEGYGTTNAVHDSSSQNNTGTWSGSGTHWTNQGKFGKAGSFNGTSDYVDVGNGASLNTQSEITVTAWVKANDVGANFEAIYARGDPTFRFGISGTAWGARPWIYINGVNYLVDNGFAPYWGQWTYIAFVFSDPQNLAQIYINGKRILNDTNATATIPTLTVNGFIGQRGDGGYLFNGLIDEVKIYSSALTEDEIKLDYNRGSAMVLGATSTEETPKSLSGLVFWVDADAPSTITQSTGVSQWNDKSGSNNHVVQATGSRQPSYVQNVLNGKPIVRFVAANSQTMTTSTNFASPVSVIYVSRQTGGANSRMLSGLTNNWLLGYWNGCHQQAFFEGWVTSSCGTPASDTNWYIQSAVETGSLSTYLENGTQIASNANGVQGPNGLSLSGYLGSSEFSNGDIAEIIIYNRALSTAEREKIEGYLANKWGLMGSLSSTHSYKNTAPSMVSSSSLAEYCAPGDTAPCFSPVAEWNFEEKTGANAYDSSGNSNTTSLTNTTWSTGKFGTSIKTNNSNSNIYVTDSTTTRLTSSGTVEAWVKPLSYPPSNPAWDVIIAKGDWGAGHNDYAIYYQHTADLLFEVRGATTNAVITIANTKTPLNQWSHVSMTWDGSTVKAYVNGQYQNQASMTQNPDTTGYNLVMGQSGGGGNVMDGSIDQVRIFNYARTPAQIAYDYNRGAPVGHWKMDECQGGSANDSSGNGNTGTITIGATGTQTAVGTCTTSGTAWYNGVTGKYNSSLNFDGTDDYVDMGDPSSGILDMGTKDFSVSFWTKLGSGNTQPDRFIEKNSGGGWDVIIYGSDGVYFETYNGGWLGFAATGVSLGTTNWHMITVTKTGTTGKIYVDGVFKNSGTLHSDVNDASSSLCIASQCSGANRFSGQIDDVKIFNYAVTANQVKTLYNKSAINFAPVTGSP